MASSSSSSSTPLSAALSLEEGGVGADVSPGAGFLSRSQSVMDDSQYVQLRRKASSGGSIRRGGDNRQSLERRRSAVVKREKAVEELLDTERNFLKDMTDISQGYEDAIPTSLLSWEERSLIFRNLKDLIRLHKALLASLERACIPGSPEGIADCFTRLNFLEVYGTFCSTHDRSLHTLQQHKGDAGLQACLAACQSRLDHKLGLADYLIKPVQRMFKYPLLLKEQLRYSAPTDANREGLERALEHMLMVAAELNSIKRQRELEAIMHGEVVVTRTQTLQDRMAAGGFEGDLSSYGTLVEEMNVTAIISGKRSSRHLYLFHTALLACKPRPDNSIAVKDIYLLRSATVDLVSEHSFSMADSLYPESRAIYQSARLDAQAWVTRIRSMSAELANSSPPSSRHGSATRNAAPASKRRGTADNTLVHGKGADASPALRRRLETVTGAMPTTSSLPSLLTPHSAHADGGSGSGGVGGKTTGSSLATPLGRGHENRGSSIASALMLSSFAAATVSSPTSSSPGSVAKELVPSSPPVVAVFAAAGASSGFISSSPKSANPPLLSPTSPPSTTSVAAANLSDSLTRSSSAPLSSSPAAALPTSPLSPSTKEEQRASLLLSTSASEAASSRPSAASVSAAADGKTGETTASLPLIIEPSSIVVPLSSASSASTSIAPAKDQSAVPLDLAAASDCGTSASGSEVAVVSDGASRSVRLSLSADLVEESEVDALEPAAVLTAKGVNAGSDPATAGTEAAATIAKGEAAEPATVNAPLSSSPPTTSSLTSSASTTISTSASTGGVEAIATIDNEPSASKTTNTATDLDAAVREEPIASGKGDVHVVPLRDNPGADLHALDTDDDVDDEDQDDDSSEDEEEEEEEEGEEEGEVEEKDAGIGGDCRGDASGGKEGKKKGGEDLYMDVDDGEVEASGGSSATAADTTIVGPAISSIEGSVEGHVDKSPTDVLIPTTLAGLESLERGGALEHMVSRGSDAIVGSREGSASAGSRPVSVMDVVVTLLPESESSHSSAPLSAAAPLNTSNKRASVISVSSPLASVSSTPSPGTSAPALSSLGVAEPPVLVDSLPPSIAPIPALSGAASSSSLSSNVSNTASTSSTSTATSTLTAARRSSSLLVRSATISGSTGSAAGAAVEGDFVVVHPPSARRQLTERGETLQKIEALSLEVASKDAAKEHKEMLSQRKAALTALLHGTRLDGRNEGTIDSLEAYVMIVMEACDPGALSMKIDARSIRGPAQYLTRFFKKYESCWLSASLVSKSITIYRGSDERHIVRSMRWQELCRAVGSTKEPVFHLVMFDRTHHIRAPDMLTMEVWVAAINSVIE